MKKTISICLFVSILFASLVIINSYQTKDKIRLQDIEMTPTAFNFYIQNADKSIAEEVAFLSKLAIDEQVSIFRTDEEDGIIIKSVVFNQESFPFEQFNLAKTNLFEKKDTIYASFDKEGEKITGKIPTFVSQNKIVLQTLEKYFSDSSKSFNGIYSVVSTSEIQKQKIIDKLSAFFNLNEDILLTPQVHGATGFVNRNLMMYVVILGINFLILTLVILYSPLTKMKDIGVMKLNGLSNGSIFFELIRFNLAVIISSCVVLNLGILSFFQYHPQNFFVHLFLAQLIVLLLYVLINSFVYVTIRKITVSKMLKNFLDFKLGVIACFAIKGCITLLITLLLVILSISFDDLVEQYRINSEWEKKGNVLTLETYNITGEDFTNFLLDNNKLEERMASVLPEFEREVNAMFISSEVIEPQNIYSKEKTKNLFKLQESYQVMRVNTNFLNTLPIDYTQSNQERIREFLLPKAYQADEKKMKYFCQLFLFYDLSSENQKNTIVEQIPVHIDYYENKNLSVFSYDLEWGTTFVNPIFVLSNAHNLTLFEQKIMASTGVGNPLKIENTVRNRQKIQAILEKKQLTDLEMKFSTLNSILGNDLASVKLGIRFISAILITIFILNIVSTVFLLACIIQSKKKQLSVYKFLGIKFFDRYKSEIFVFISFYCVQLLVVTIGGRSLLILPFALLLIFVDILLTMIITLNREKKSLASSLKGEYA